MERKRKHNSSSLYLIKKIRNNSYYSRLMIGIREEQEYGEYLLKQ